MTEIGIDLLERYLVGLANPDESRRVEAWLSEDPRRWAELSALREALEQRDLSDGAVEEALAEVWTRLTSQIGAPQEPLARPRGRQRATSREFPLPGQGRRLMLALAAALVVLMVGGGVLAILLLRRSSAPSDAFRVAATAPGERAALRLPDGTQVMLSVASRLQYPTVFAVEARQVVLEGEAYFDVAQERQQPFVVRAGSLVAQDLGTQFTVRAYPDDPDARVAVREGMVVIRSWTNGVEEVVSPGQLGRLAAGRLPTVEQADTAAVFAWTEGRLVFDGIPLRDALPQLGRWFDLDFRLADSALGGVPLTVTLKTQPTPDVLESIAASLGMRQRKEGRTVTLYSADPPR